MACKSKLWSSLSGELKEDVGKYCKPFIPHSQAACIATYCVVISAAIYVKLDHAKHALSYASHAFSFASHYVSHDSLCIITCALFLLTICICIMYQTVWRLPCYLVDFCCTQGDDNSCASLANFGRFLHSWRSVTDSNLKFQFKVFLRSGVGEEAYVPPALLQKGEDVDMQDAREESENLILDAARRILQKTGVDPKEIGIVIVNSSLFSPVPSLTAYLVNVLNMRSNVKSFNLAGMGCSSSLLAIDLAARLLKVHRNSYALIVSTENITENMYFGKDRSMMISNCLFRCGSAAILLTNKPSARRHAKMQLLHCLRTNLAADNKAYECAQHVEDSEGNRGVSLQASLLEVAGNALRMNVTKLAPSILPLSELMKVAVSLVKRGVVTKGAQKYEPNFKKAIDHFCIHPGGRAVIDAIGKGLKLSEMDVEPGRMALERFGNTSSSGIWYALAYCEAKGRLKKGNKVWQIALGTGFKCNSGVWLVLRDIDPRNSIGCNPWLACIDRYPVPEHVIENRSAKFKEMDSMFAALRKPTSQEDPKACPQG